MDALFEFLTGVTGLVVLGLAALFVVGWLLMRLSARKLQDTT